MRVLNTNNPTIHNSTERNNTDNNENRNITVIEPNQPENKLLTRLKNLFCKYNLPQEKLDVVFKLFGGSITEEQLNNLEKAFETNYNKNNGKLDFDTVIQNIEKLDTKDSKPTPEELDQLIKSTPKEEIQQLFDKALEWYDSEFVTKVFEDNNIDTKELYSNRALTKIDNPDLYNTDLTPELEDGLIADIQNSNSEKQKEICQKYKERQEEVYNTDTTSFSEEEIKEHNIKKERCAKVASIITIGIATSKNSDIQTKNALLKDINDSQKEYPTYKYYLESIANYVNSPNYSYDIAVDKLKDILNTATNNEYSKIEASLPEKTAIDQENGGFKNDTGADTIQASSDNAKKILETITPKEDKTFVVVKDTAKSDKPAQTSTETKPKTESFFGQKFTEYILTGKVETYSNAVESAAIDNYKRMDFAQQGKLLQVSIGKFLNKLIDNTKTSTLENLLAAGWKGASYYITEQVEDTVQERKDKLKQGSLPS